MRYNPGWFTPCTSIARPHTIARLALAIVLAVTLLLAVSVSGLSVAKAYYCPANQLNTCEAVNDWPGGPIEGATTSLNVVPLSCSNCDSANFLNRALWLTQRSSGVYVEVGEGTIGSSTDYYWGDWLVGQNYQLHPLAQVPNGDYYNYANLALSTGFQGSVKVEISSPNFSWVDWSTNNNMIPDDIEIGQELGGTGGASGGAARFVYNQWIDTNGYSHYQTADGSISNQYPVSVSWNVYPHQSSTGGSLYVSSCCTGSSSPMLTSDNRPTASPGVTTSRSAVTSLLGVPAIQPRAVHGAVTVPAFTSGEAAQYAKEHPVQHAVIRGRTNVSHVLFMTNQQADAQMHLGVAKLSPNALVCIVELSGSTYTFPGHDGRTPTFSTGFELFDAQTGNLVIEGGM